MANIPVSASVHSLLNSAGNLTASTNALGTLGAPVTSAAIVAKIAGVVQDVVRIGKEYMPESFDVISLKLGNAGTVSLPAGTLSLNTAGQMVLHDGLRNGNNISNIPNSNSNQQFVKTILTANSQNTTYQLPLARFTLPASTSVNGKIISFTGDVYVRNAFTVQPNAGLYLFWKRYGVTALEQAVLFTLPITSNASHKISVSLSLVLFTDNTVSGAFDSPVVIRTLIGATEGSACLSFADGINGSNLNIPSEANDLITIGQPIDIEFGIATIDSSGLVHGTYVINGFMGISNS